MKILLLNKNPIISKLVKLTVQKLGDEFEELEEFNESKADIIIVDNDEKIDLNSLKNFAKKLIVLSKTGNEILDDEMILNLHKPFLPTDLIKLIEQANSTPAQILEEKELESTKANPSPTQAKEKDIENISQENEAHQDDKELSLDDLNLNALSLEESSLDQNTDNAQEHEELSSEITQETKQHPSEPKEQDENFNEHDLDQVFKMNDDEKATSLSETKKDENTENSFNEKNLPETLETEDFASLSKDLDIQDDKDDEKDGVGFSVEERKVDFNDIPSDAKFIGQSKDESLSKTEPSPQIVEANEKEFVPSTHESIKKQLKELDEMDQNAINKDEKVPDESLKDSELDKIKERDIKIALGENVEDLQDEGQKASVDESSLEQKNTNKEEDKKIIDELSKSITNAITSSINDETLKAALKGMNMNINISINFDEDKH